MTPTTLPWPKASSRRWKPNCQAAGGSRPGPIDACVDRILPKLRNRWSDEGLIRQADRRPTRILRDLHGRGIRNQIGEQELAPAGLDLELLLDQIEAMLIGGPWLIGPFSLADITVAPYMLRLEALGHGRFWSALRRPRVNDWYWRLSDRPAFQVATGWPEESGGGYQEAGLGTA